MKTTKQIHWDSGTNWNGQYCRMTMCRRVANPDCTTAAHAEITCPTCRKILELILSEDRDD